MFLVTVGLVSYRIAHLSDVCGLALFSLVNYGYCVDSWLVVVCGELLTLDFFVDCEARRSLLAKHHFGFCFVLSIIHVYTHPLHH